MKEKKKQSKLEFYTEKMEFWKEAWERAYFQEDIYSAYREYCYYSRLVEIEEAKYEG